MASDILETDLSRLFVEFSIQKIRQHTSEIEKCMARLTDEQVWARHSENENAIGNLVLHLCGNVGQRTTAISGAPDMRVRELEFSATGGLTIAELTERLRTAVENVVAALGTVSAERLGQVVRVGEFHYTILEGTYHMVGHFALHTGQIIFATKRMTGESMGFYQPPARAVGSPQ
jgi:hypothetical protein